jgi:hypothetical protein
VATRLVQLYDHNQATGAHENKIIIAKFFPGLELVLIQYSYVMHVDGIKHLFKNKLKVEFL